jgi:hypothetical protein
VGKKGSVARGSERAFLVSKERRGGCFCLISIEQWHPFEGRGIPGDRPAAAAGETAGKEKSSSFRRARS